MAIQRLNVLSDADIRVLKSMAELYRNRSQDGGLRDTEEIIESAPDTYLAKLPAGGIPAMMGDEPGYADDCEFYRILNTDAPSVQEVGMQRRVFNLSTSAITAEYITVTRTKAGLWVISSGGGGSYLKHLGRFTLNLGLGVTDAQQYATLTDEYGEGGSHFDQIGTATGTSTSTGTQDNAIIIVENFETHTDGIYEFYGDAEDAGLAYYHYYDGLYEHWVIIFMECP